jgi:hypothetical protein
MKSLKPWTLSVLIFLLPACGQQLVEFPNPDASTHDTRTADRPNGDAVGADLGISDVPTTDAAGVDAAPPDDPIRDAANEPLDALVPDSAGRDSGRIETAPNDARIVDAFATDPRAVDAPIVDDSGVPLPALDGAPLDVPIIDTATSERTNLEASTNDTEGSACRQSPVALGTADNFAVLAGSSVTNTGPTSVTGDLGASPGTSITGFPPGTVVGTQHAGDATAAQAVADLTTAYNDAAGRTLCAVTVAGNLGGQTLGPGLYKSTSSLAISSGDLTLDAQGDATAVFIFQIASTLTTTSGRQIVLSGGAKATNVFWQVGTSATLGSASVFRGTLMADQSVTLNTGASLTGRALARIAGVTLDANPILKPTP